MNLTSRKKSYNSPEIKVYTFNVHDVIRATGPGPGPDPPDMNTEDGSCISDIPECSMVS